MTDPALAAILFIQFAIILATCRALGWAFAGLRQPLVVAEMVAGFLLGPSFFGALLPSLQARVFPTASLHSLYVLSQIGLVLYMFSVGLEFRLDLMTRFRRRALGVSAAGIAFPFALGGVLALAMVGSGGFFTAGGCAPAGLDDTFDPGDVAGRCAGAPAADGADGFNP